jgi:Putative auto-transporter adhesin, head GIN domain
MKRSHALLFALGLGLLLSGCDVLFDTIQGSGKSTTETRNVSGFTTVELDGSGDLQLQQTGTESLTITADDNLLQYLTSDINNGRLKLGTKSGTNVRSSKPVLYTLTVKNLNGIVLAGSGNIGGKDLASDSMRIEIAGSGNITTSGSADHAELIVEGSGNYSGDSFKTKNARVEIDGSGGVIVAASDTLDVTINGSGSVEYIGDPKVTTTSHGSGTVGKRH